MKKPWIVLFGATTVLFNLQAQIRMSDCVRTALDNNPALKVRESEAAVAVEDLRQARAAFLPTLDFSGSYRRQSEVPELAVPPIENPFGGPPIVVFPEGGMTLGSLDNADLRVTLVQPVFTGLRLLNRMRFSQAMASGKTAEIRKNRIDLIAGVETAYGNLLKAEKFLDIAKQAKAQVNAHLRDVRRFKEQGLARSDELLRVQVKSSEAELCVVQAGHSVRLARTVLENLLGKPLLPEALLEPMPEEEIGRANLDSSITLALTTRPELAMVEDWEDAGRASKNAAVGNWFPTLGIFGSVGYGKPGLDFIGNEWMDYWLVGVTMEWNLWNWGKTRSQIRQAGAKLQSAVESKRQVRDNVVLDVTQACLRMEEAAERLNLAETMERLAQESFRVAETLYRQGQVTNTDYFDAQSEFVRARLALTQAEIDVALAASNWRRAVGINENQYLP